MAQQDPLLLEGWLDIQHASLGEDWWKTQGKSPQQRQIRGSVGIEWNLRQLLNSNTMVQMSTFQSEPHLFHSGASYLMRNLLRLSPYLKLVDHYDYRYINKVFKFNQTALPLMLSLYSKRRGSVCWRTELHILRTLRYSASSLDSISIYRHPRSTALCLTWCRGESKRLPRLK